MKTNRIKPPIQLATAPRLLTLRYYDIYGQRSVSCELLTRPGVTISFSLDDWRRLIWNLQEQKRLQTKKNRIFAGFGLKFLKTVPKPTRNNEATNPFYQALGVSAQTRSPVAPKIVLVFHHTTLALSRNQYIRLRECFLKAARKLESR